MGTGDGAVIWRATTVVVVLLLCSAALLSPRAAAVWLSLPPSGTKCVSEEIQANVIVLVDYTVVCEDESHGTATISGKMDPFRANGRSFKDGTEGEIEIEKLALHEVEMRRKDLLPVFEQFYSSQSVWSDRWTEHKS